MNPGKNSAVNVGEPIDQGALSCVVCGNTLRPRWVVQGYQHVECPNCKCIRVLPCPTAEELQNYYDSMFYVSANGHRETVNNLGLEDLELLEGLGSLGKLLEIGCAWGHWLNVARKRGWQVRGVEVASESSHWAKQELGLDVYSGQLEDSPLAGCGAFDVVAANNVIEHVPNPIMLLQEMRQCLRPGGLIFLRTANISSLTARVNGPAWIWVAPPAHLFLFSPEGMSLALQHAGFEVVKIFTRRGDCHNPWFEFVRGSAVRLRLRDHFRHLLAGKPAAHGPQAGEYSTRREQAISSLSRKFDAGLLFLRPLEKMLDRLNFGPELVAVARVLPKPAKP